MMRFMMRFIIVIIFINLFDTQLLVLIRSKLIKLLRDDTRRLIFCKSFKIFVDDVKNVNLIQQQKKFAYRFYIDLYLSTKKEKKFN